MDDLYKFLLSKNILEILEGDIKFGYLTIEGSEPFPIAMPYLSGPVICDISTTFGLEVSYEWGGGALSRWQYLSNLIEYCIENHRVSDLLAFLFSKKQFVSILKRRSASAIELGYKKIVKTIIDQINGELYCNDSELCVIGTQFIVHKIGSTVSVSAPKIEKIDREYIKNILERALQDISNSNFDSAITKARTLLEESLIYVIEKKSETPVGGGDITKLFNQVKTLYNMHQNKDADKRVNGLLAGLEKTLSAIAAMRNGNSDSHGLGSRRIGISDYHARLFVNSAVLLADFILEVSEHNIEQAP